MSKGDKNSKQFTKVKNYILIFSILFWIYLILKLFIFDLDYYLLQEYFPQHEWVIKYKFFIIIGVIALYWFFVKTKTFLYSCLLIIFYPFYFIFWQIPKVLFKRKSWLGIFAAFGIVITICKSAKLNFITFALVSISIIVVFANKSDIPLSFAITILFLFLMLHFAKRFYFAFKPFRNFSLKPELFSKLNKNLEEAYHIPPEFKLKKTNELTKEQQGKWITNLQGLILFNKIYLFLISKLRSFQRSKVIISYAIIILIYTLFLTIVIFAMQNYALFKLNPDCFNNPGMHSYGYFLYYSFNTMFTNSIADFSPICGWARLLNSLEIFFAFVILVILVSVIFTVFQERHNQEIDSVIDTLKHQGMELETYINSEYKLTVGDALKEIENLKGSMINIIYYFSTK